MKSIKDLRESYNLITEKEEHDMNKLTQLVRAGLFDAKKLSALKRAMDKPADKMTAQEKRMMINLLDALMAEVLSDKQVYRKIKQDVMREAKDWETKDYLSKADPRIKRYGYPSQKEAPSILLLKRKAIRVYPDGQKVALYYAQAIDKYVTIPYNEIGINEERDLNEISLSGIASNIGDYISDKANNSSSTPKEPKYLEPMAPKEPKKLDVGGPSRDDSRSDAIRSRTERLSRLANQAMAKDVRESFQNKLEVLREAGAPRPPKGYVPPKIRPKAGIGPGGKAAPEKSTWEKLTDIKDDGTVTGLGKDLLPVVGTVRQAKRTGEAYKKTKSDFEKGDYWGAAKGAADTALQGGLTALSGVGDVATATGLGAAVVTPIRGAIAASKAARTARNVEKFLQTAKTVPVAKAPAAVRPALPAPEVKTPTANISPTKADKIRKNIAADTAITRQSNVAAASREAEAFRKMYPKTKDTSVSPSAKEPKEFKPQVSPAAREPAKAKVSVKEREPSTFKLAEPATSKGQLVPVSAREPVKTKVSVSAREPSVVSPKIVQPKVKKPTIPVSAREPGTKLTVGKVPVVKDTSASDVAKKDQTQVKPQPQTQTQPKKQKTDTTPTKTKPDEEGTGKREPKERKPWWLPGAALALKPGKDLSPLEPKLKMTVSGPKREGDPSAIASRQASIERAALKAQASIKESVELDGNLFELNNKEAQKVTALYESLNKKNKKKMVEMMNESAESLEKVISFAVRQ